LFAVATGVAEVGELAGAAPTWDVGLLLFDDELPHAAKPPASKSNAAMAPAWVYRERLRLENEMGISPP
jgi:hypothetical protein